MFRATPGPPFSIWMGLASCDEDVRGTARPTTEGLILVRCCWMPCFTASSAALADFSDAAAERVDALLDLQEMSSAIMATRALTIGTTTGIRLIVSFDIA